MLIYNAKKEFVGVDEKDLATLGFSNLAALHNEVGDFADLFVKTPGFIHNFKHVHWIDFITCAESSEESKAIINVNNKNFRARITIEKIFLTDNASTNGYIVYLNNLRELTQSESENVSADVVARPIIQDIPAPVATPVVKDNLDTSEFEEAPQETTVTHDPYETPLEVNFDDDEDDYDLETTPVKTDDVVPEQLEQHDSVEEMLDVGDLTLDEEDVAVEEPVNEVSEQPFDNGYTYDPQVASDELGLPLDLIEEFIEDFIAQAREFKEGLYTALEDGELDQVKILSHKLKGVAANLRIEDAFEILTTINTSDDVNIIEQNLNTFYRVIAKLAGEEPTHPVVTQKVEVPEVQTQAPEPETVVAETQSEDDDLYSDILSIDDSEVPQKIEMPELADDDFVAEDTTVDEIESDLADMDDIDLLDVEDEITAVEDDIALDDIEDIVIDESEDVTTPVNVEYSKEASAAEIGIDSETFNELFEDYINEADIITQDMKSAVDAGDFDTCRHEALKLQGMSDNMRVTMFSDELSTLMNSTEPAVMHKAIDTIENVINQISTTGA